MTSKTEIQSEFKTFYASLISQGFTAEQAQNLVSSVARQAEKEPILLSVTAELKAIKTPGDVVKQLQAGVMASLDDSKGFFGAFDSLFSQDQGKALGVGVEALMKAYDSAPIETMQAFSDIIAKVKADGTGFFASSVADGIDDYADSIKETNPVLAEAILKADGFENKLKMIIATQAGMDLSNVTDQLLDFAIKADAASNAATSMQNALREDLDKAKKALEDNHRSYITAKEDEIIADEKAIKKRQEATKKQLEGIQNEIDKREKTIDAAQEKIDAIEKERDVVNEFYDGQLDALDAINKKEEYNAQQRQTMYDALGALSRGDIQGFMAARETMAGNAGANVREQAKDMLTTRQENANKVLNARRDEQEAIIDQEQKMIKLRREQMETIQKATEKFIEGKQKEIEKTQELMRTEQRRYSAANSAIDDLYAKNPSEWTQQNLNAVNTAVQKHTSQVAKTVGNSLKNASATIPKAFTQYYENAAKAAGLSPAELKNFLDLKKALGQKNVKIEKGDALYKLLNNMGLGNLANTAGLADLKKLTGTMHTGGYVGGNDPEPLKTLERGEFVLNKDAVNRIGRGRLEAMNSGTGGELSPFNATAGIPQAVHNKNEVGTNSAVSLLRTQQLPMDMLRMKALNIAAGQNVDYGSPSSSGFIKPPGAMTSPYGMRIHPVTRENKMHNGIDFGMQPGDAVPSIGPGKVISSSVGPDVGGKVLVRHPNGFDSEYYHMSPNGLASGNVNAGSTLGRVGNASEMGRLSTGPHLHLGMMKDGNYVDPKNYLPLRQGGIVKNDGTPAMLHRGEMVLPAPTTRELMGPQYSVPQPSGDQGMVSVTTVGGDKTTINVTINSNQNPNAIASQVIARINDTIKSRRVGRS
jgi:murein DD-endopeptidase MepM/ murein hydrolase activator NlpD